LSRHICLHPLGRFPALIQTVAEFVIVTGGAFYRRSLDLLFFSWDKFGTIFLALSASLTTA